MAAGEGIEMRGEFSRGPLLSAVSRGFKLMSELCGFVTYEAEVRHGEQQFQVGVERRIRLYKVGSFLFTVAELLSCLDTRDNELEVSNQISEYIKKGNVEATAGRSLHVKERGSGCWHWTYEMAPGRARCRIISSLAGC
jgi:hypothetical protein